MKMKNAEGEEVTTTEGIREIVDTHYDKTFNLGKERQARDNTMLFTSVLHDMRIRMALVDTGREICEKFRECWKC